MRRWKGPADEDDPVHYVAGAAFTIEDARAWVVGVCGITDSAPLIQGTATAERILGTTTIEDVTCGACRRVIRDRSTP